MSFSFSERISDNDYLKGSKMAEEVSLGSRLEFRAESAHVFNVKGPVRWIISHLMRYPLFPLIMGFAAVANNFLYSYIQILVGQAFDLISAPGFLLSALLTPVLGFIECLPAVLVAIRPPTQFEVVEKI